jgi:hypothetical protein
MDDRRFALIVASSRYDDPVLRRLEAPAYDAKALAGVLGDPLIGNFDVKTLVDEPASKAMQEIETFFDGNRREDLMLLYFSGHGILDESSRLYFATVDTRVARPRSTAVPAAFVNDLMSESRSRRQVLVLDCCNSGAFARGAKAGASLGTKERLEGRGRVVITASDALQYAFEGERVEGEGIRSVFTGALVEGLRTGEADLDGDGYVSLDELYEFVYGRVVDESPRQRPGKWAYAVEGQIFVARTRDGTRVRPAAVAPRSTPVPSPRVRLPLRTRRAKWIAAAAAAAVAAGASAATLALVGGTSAPKSRDLARPPKEIAQLLTAWKTRDRPAAGRLADADSVSRLFQHAFPSPAPAFKGGTCGLYSTENATNAPVEWECDYEYFASSGPRVLAVRVHKFGSSFRIVNVDFRTG